MKNAEITVCLPVYQAEGFLRNTLDSLREQTFNNFRVLVSIDPSTDASEPICRDIAARDPRFTITVQKERLGWIGNLNNLFERVETEWFFFLPHDDLLVTDYIETLYTEASHHPEAINIFSDIRQIGVFEGTMESAPLDGSTADRLIAFLAEDLRSIPFRGLTRRAVLDAGVRLRDNAFDGFAADVIFVLETLCIGPMRRVPRLLYQRNEREDSIVRGWEQHSRAWRLAAWADHVAQTLEILAGAPLAEAEHHLVRCAGIVRLLRQYWLGHDHYIEGGDSGNDELMLFTGLASRLLGAQPWSESTFEHLERNDTLRRFVGRLRFQEALFRIKQGDWCAAEPLLAAAIERDTGNAEAHRQLGITLKQRGQVEDCLRALRHAVELTPSDIGCLTTLADALAANDELTEAALLAGRAVKLAPDFAPAHFQLSHISNRQGKLQDAIACAERAAALNPGNPEYREHLQLLRSNH